MSARLLRPLGGRLASAASGFLGRSGAIPTAVSSCGASAGGVAPIRVALSAGVRRAASGASASPALPSAAAAAAPSAAAGAYARAPAWSSFARRAAGVAPRRSLSSAASARQPCSAVAVARGPSSSLVARRPFGSSRAPRRAAEPAEPAKPSAASSGAAAPVPSVVQTLPAPLAKVREALSKAPAAFRAALPPQARAAPAALRRAAGLQLDALWRSHGGKFALLVGALIVYMAWRLMYGVATSFMNLSETMAELGFLALAVSGALMGALWLRARFTISPPAVHRLAMYRLNAHPGLLEVMGAPLVGSDLRASVLTGGGVAFKGLTWPKVRSRRLHMIFPIRGSERRGIVSVQAKKRRGRHELKLVAVDVPTAAGKDQRIYVVGGPKQYERGGILGELRDPFLRAVSMEDAFAREDDYEDEEESRNKGAVRNPDGTVTRPAQAPDLYFWERVYLAGKGVADGARGAARKTGSALEWAAEKKSQLERKLKGPEAAPKP